MQVMVTGASGYVGSHTVNALLNAGHRVRALVRDPAAAGRALNALGIGAGEVDLIHGDMLHPATVAQALTGCTTALHAAAQVGVTGRGGDVVEANVRGTRNVIGTAVEMGLTTVVHVSTIAAFVPPATSLIDPDGSPSGNPRGPYGHSKLAADRYVRGLQEAGAPVTIVYPGGVCGPQQPRLDAMMEGLAGGLGRGLAVPRQGGVSIIDVRDLAEGLARAVTGTAVGRRLMLGGHFVTWPQFADMCDEVTGRRCRRFAVTGPMLTGLAALLDLAKRVRWFDYPLTRDAAEYMVRLVPTDDGPSLQALGLSLRPAEETLADSIRWLAESGHLDPHKAGRLGGEHRTGVRRERQEHT